MIMKRIFLTLLILIVGMNVGKAQGQPIIVPQSGYWGGSTIQRTGCRGGTVTQAFNNMPHFSNYAWEGFSGIGNSNNELSWMPQHFLFDPHLTPNLAPGTAMIFTAKPFSFLRLIPNCPPPGDPHPFFSHPVFCNWFYVCDNWTPVLWSCSPGLVWNGATCDFPANVNCFGRATAPSGADLGAIRTDGQTMCLGGSATTIGSVANASGGAVRYRWLRNGVIVPNAIGATHTPSADLQGTFVYTREVEFVGFGYGGWTPSDGTWTLIVHPPFNPGSINSTGQTACFGGSAITIGSTVDASGGAGNIRYRWLRDGAEVFGAVGVIYTPVIDAPGTFTYTRFARADGCGEEWFSSAGSWTMTVVPEFNPGAINTVAKTVCFNASAGTIENVIPASGGDINNIEYRWMRNNVEVPDATGATFIPPTNVSGIFVYTRQAKDGLCRSDWITSAGNMILTVHPLFNAGSIQTVGQAVTINGLANTIGNVSDALGGVGHIEYRWKRNDDIIAGATGAIHIPRTDIAGTFVYTREARDGTCNDWTLSIGEWVLTVIQISITGTDSICIGQTTQLSATITGTWVSNSPAIASVDANSGLVTGVSQGVAIFTFRAADTDFEATVAIIVLDETLPQVSNIVTKTDLSEIPHTLIYPNPTEGLSFQWYHNGIPIEGATSQFFHPANGLEEGEYKVYVFRSHLPACGTHTEPFQVSLPLMSTSAEWFFLYPNPSDGRFSVVFNKDVICDETTVTIGLFSLQGTRIIERQVTGSENFEFNENLNSGIYVLRVTTDSNLSETKQIVIRK